MLKLISRRLLDWWMLNYGSYLNYNKRLVDSIRVDLGQLGWNVHIRYVSVYKLLLRHGPMIEV